MITAEELQLALDGSISAEALETALAEQPPVRWGPATPETLEAYARKPVLQRGEAVALLQGFTPPAPDFQDAKIFYLDDFADVITRFLRDADTGVIPVPCRPQELVEWAAVLGVSLPSVFSAIAKRGADPRPVANVVPAAGLQPAIVPIPQSTPKLLSPVPLTDDYALWQRMAEAEARQYRDENNRWPTRVAVSKLLAKQIPVEAATIERRTRNTWK